MDGGASRCSAWSARSALQVTVGGSEFLPKSDYGTIAIDVRTPSSASLEYARVKVEKAAELARHDPGDQGHQQQRESERRARLRGHRQASTSASARLQEIAGDLREQLKQLVGAEYVVLDDLNNGAQKPVQIQFYGPDSRKLMEITNDFMEQDAQRSRARWTWASRSRSPKDELRIELDRGLANQLGISVGDAAQALRVAFAGVEVGDWVDPDRRIARRRGAPASRRSRRCLQHRAPAGRRWPAPT